MSPKARPQDTHDDIPAIDAEKIIRFIGEKIAARAFSWGGTAVFGAIFRGDDKLDAIVKTLKRIEANQERILRELAAIMRELKWQSLIIQVHDSEQAIVQKWARIQEIARNSDPKERRELARAVREAVLHEGPGGVRAALHNINDVLVGKSLVDPDSKGLLVAWHDKLFPLLCRWGGVSSRDFYAHVQAYWAGVSHLQFMGLTLLLAAYAASEQDAVSATEVEIQTQKLRDSLEAQRRKLRTVYSPLWDRIIGMPEQKHGFVESKTRRYRMYHTYIPERRINGLQLMSWDFRDPRAKYECFFEATDSGNFRMGIDQSFRFYETKGSISTGAVKKKKPVEIKVIPHRNSAQPDNTVSFLCKAGYIRPDKDGKLGSSVKTGRVKYSWFVT